MMEQHLEQQFDIWHNNLDQQPDQHILFWNNILDQHPDQHLFFGTTFWINILINICCLTQHDGSTSGTTFGSTWINNPINIDIIKMCALLARNQTNNLHFISMSNRGV